MIINLTPTKNEEWIVGFTGSINCQYFDNCCYYDQMSSDETVGIITQLQNSIVRLNQSPIFNEAQRQIDLIDIARELRCEVFLALDADEALFGAPEMFKAELKSLAPGTSVYYEWINISSCGRHVWSGGFKRFGFVDDGTEHRPTAFHSERVPVGKFSFYSSKIKVVHFQYLNHHRFLIKHIEYIERELESHGDVSRVDLFVKYSHMIHSKKRPISNMSDLSYMIARFRDTYLISDALSQADINENKFVRKLIVNDEWLLLQLITMLARFAGIRINVQAKLSTFRKMTALFICCSSQHKNFILSRIAIRMTKFFMKF